MRATVLTKDILIRLNTAAIRRRANRTLAPVMLHRLPADKLYPVTSALLTGADDDTIRARIIFDEDGKGGSLDIPVADFNRLPVVDTEE